LRKNAVFNTEKGPSRCGILPFLALAQFLLSKEEAVGCKWLKGERLNGERQFREHSGNEA
jgi:hypothetical protein